MTIILKIFSVKFFYFKRLLREKNPAQKIVLVLFILLFLAVASAEFLGFLRAFNILKTREFFGPPLTLFVLEEFLLLVSVLFLASACITGFFIIYKSPDLKFLLALPVRPEKIFFAKSLETAVLSSWPLILLGAPLILAFGISHEAGAVFYLLSLTVLLLFLIFTIFLATLLDMLLAVIFKRVSKILALIFIFLLMITTAYALALFLVPKEVTLAVIFQADNIGETIATTNLIEKTFKNLPSHWLAMAIFKSAENSLASFYSLFYTGAAALVLLLLNLFLAKKAYRALLLWWQEGTFHAESDLASGAALPAVGSKTVPRFFRGKIGALLEKDLLAFFRNYEELSRAAFIFFLLLIYLVITATLGQRVKDIFGYAEGLVWALHLITVSYFANTLALRFVYPSVSLEGRGAWILWSSPVDRGKLFFAKFAFWNTLLFISTLALIIAVSYQLNFSIYALAVSAFMLLLLISAITAISLGLGTAFANFNETNVERLATSFGGLAATFLSLGYGLFMGAANAAAISSSSYLPAGYSIAAALIVSLSLTYIFLRVGYKKIKTLEVV